MNELTPRLQGHTEKVDAYLQTVAEEMDPIVRPVIEHVLFSGGKRLRPFLTMTMAGCLGADIEKTLPLASSLELLHTATLLHDDIVDGAGLRRGKAAAHIEFGKTETILAGDVLLAKANKIVADYDIPRLTSVLSEAIMRTAVGEVMEIAGNRRTDMTLDEYMAIITGKTAYLFEGGCRCGAALADADPAVEEAAAAYGLNLGIAFQLVDDALDYSATAVVSGKQVGGDLREGKITMPLILLFSGMESKQRTVFIEKIKSGELDDESRETIIAQINEQGYAEQTRSRAEHFALTASDALNSFPEGEEKDVLKLIANYVTIREK